MEMAEKTEVILYLPDNFIQVGGFIVNFIHNAVDSDVQVRTVRQADRIIGFTAPGEIAGDVLRGIRDFLSINGLSFGVQQQEH